MGFIHMPHSHVPSWPTVSCLKRVISSFIHVFFQIMSMSQSISFHFKPLYAPLLPFSQSIYVTHWSPVTAPSVACHPLFISSPV